MTKRLGDSDTAFLEDVSAAVFSNPFSEERHRVDVRLAEAVGSESREGLLAKLLARVEARTTPLLGEQLDARVVDPSSRALAERAAFFVLFHRHSAQLELHIAEQLAAGAEPVEASFGDALMTDLQGVGLDAEKAQRIVGVFFQMRRAFHFIDRGITGRAPAVRRFREQLWNNVFTSDIGRYERLLWDKMEDFSTILLGETGSGKGAAAAAIGRSGFIPYDRKRRRFAESFTAAFVSLNLSAHPEALIESELFGHKKGAFTGAIEGHQGVFSRCSPHGAVFLDEIGEVSIPVQIKLLRVLQEREFTPVGSHSPQRFRGRVIAATNRDLAEHRRTGQFRNDFYYRLCSDLIEVPPLRTRLAEDEQELEELVGALLERIASAQARGGAAPLTAEIRAAVGRAYAWPGNVRELEQCVRRFLLGQRYLPDVAAAPTDELDFAALDGGQLSAKELLDGYCRMLYVRHGTYEEVARRTALDRRTVKKHIVGG